MSSAGKQNNSLMAITVAFMLDMERYHDRVLKETKKLWKEKFPYAPFSEFVSYRIEENQVFNPMDTRGIPTSVCLN